MSELYEQDGQVLCRDSDNHNRFHHGLERGIAIITAAIDLRDESNMFGKEFQFFDTLVNLFEFTICDFITEVTRIEGISQYEI